MSSNGQQKSMKKKNHEVYQMVTKPNIYEARPWALKKPTKKQNGQKQDEK
jgi:hypothetical protein